MSFGLFKKFNHRRFDYKTRYYDADKEALRAIVGKYDKSIDQTELRKSRIRSGFDSKKSSSSISSEFSRNSNIRLVIIIAILCYMSYMFIMSDMFLKVLESLSK